MPQTPDFSRLLSAATLGVARRDIPPEITGWLHEIGATTEDNDQAEQLLVALGIIERLNRFGAGTRVRSDTIAAAPPETGKPPSPTLARALQLILEGTYPALLDEAITVVIANDSYVPPLLLPALHLRAAALLNDEPRRAARYVKAGGKRAIWLAGQHPEWEALSPDYDLPAAFRREGMPSRRAALLTRWRLRDPVAAREGLAVIWEKQSPKNQETLLQALETGLTAEDIPWLRQQLGPKRKGVRRQLGRLLLLAREARALADFTALARSITGDRGQLAPILPGKELKDTLLTYGGLRTRESLPALLLELLPPTVWAEITGVPLPTFWLSLKPAELKSAGIAVRNFAEPETLKNFAAFLLRESPERFGAELAGEIIQLLPDEDFTALFDDLLTHEKDALRMHALPRLLALSRRNHWSERLSKAMINALLANLQGRYLDYQTQRDLAAHWKLTIPLLHIAIFPWLRTQLHALTERPDAFGRLAVETLQTTAFRSKFAA